MNRIVAPNDPEVFVDQVSNLSSSEEAVFFVSFHFLQTDLFLEAGILDDFVRAEQILASSNSKFGPGVPLIEREDLRSSTDSTIATSLIHCISSV